MFHLLTCLTTFNIVGYINKIELNNWCGVPSICNSLHIELHLICSVVCCTLHAMPHLTGHASYLFAHHAMLMWCLFTMIVCFFPVLLLRVGSDNVTFVRNRSTTSVCLLHGLVLLPCGISGKMIIPSKSLLSLLASCSFYLLCRDTYHLLYHASHIAMSSL